MPWVCLWHAVALQLNQSALRLSDVLWMAKHSSSGFSVLACSCSGVPLKKRGRKRKCKSKAVIAASTGQEAVISDPEEVLIDAHQHVVDCGDRAIK